MPRSPRVTIGGIAYHVLNRANARMTLFQSEADYQLMASVLAEGLLVGDFEGIDSKRGLDGRCSDSLTLRECLGL